MQVFLDIRKQSVVVGVDNVKQATTFSCMVDSVDLMQRRKRSRHIHYLVFGLLIVIQTLAQ